MEATNDSVSAKAAVVEMEDAVSKLQGELSAILGGLAKLRQQLEPTETLAGDKASDKMQKEVADAMRQQTEALQMMEQTVQTFPRRWARFEVNTSQRKSLLMDIKARKKQQQEQLPS